MNRRRCTPPNDKGVDDKMEQDVSTAVITGISAVSSVFVEVNYKVAIVLVILMILDIIIASLFAIMEGNFVSKVFKKGLVTKILIFLLALALLLFIDILADYDIEIPFASTFGVLLCFNEIMSIIESFTKYGVLIPQVITKWFYVNNDKINK